MTVFCTKCGTAVNLPDGAARGFCGSCGSPVQTIAGAPSPAPTPTQSAQTQSAQTQSAQTQSAQTQYYAEAPAQYAPPSQSAQTQYYAEAPPTPAQYAPQPAPTYAQYASPEPQRQQPYVQPVFVAPPEPPAKGKNPVKKLVLLIAAIVAVAAVAVTALSVTGVIPPLFSFGNATYEEAESGALRGALADLAGGKGKKADITVSYEPSGELAGELEDYIDDSIDTMSLTGNISQLGISFLTDATFTLNDWQVRAVGAFDGKDLTLSLPDVTEYIMSFIYDPYDGDVPPDLDLAAFEKTVADILSEYFRIAGEIAVVEKDAELSGSGGALKVKADRYTMEFTYEHLTGLCLFAIDKLRENDNLLDYVNALLKNVNHGWARYPGRRGFDVESALDSLEDAINENYADIDDDERMLRMSVWVKGKNIVARDIDRVYQLDGTELSYMAIADGKTAYLELDAAANGVFLALEGELNNTGGAWDGVVEISAGPEDNRDYGVPFEAAVEGFKISGKTVEGSVTLTGGDGGDGTDVEINMNFQSPGGGRQVVELSGELLTHGDTIDFGSARLEYGLSDIRELTITEYGADDEVFIEYPHDGEQSEEIYERSSELSDEIFGYIREQDIPFGGFGGAPAGTSTTATTTAAPAATTTAAAAEAPAVTSAAAAAMSAATTAFAATAAQSTTATNAAPEERVYLRFMHNYSGSMADSTEAQVFHRHLDSYLAEHPEVELELLPVEYESYATMLNLAAASGDMPDIYFCDYQFYKDTFDDYLLGDITEYIDEELYRPTVFNQLKRDGRIYALPTRFTVSHMIFYNRMLWDEAGLELPETWDELFAAKIFFDDMGIPFFAYGSASPNDVSPTLMSVLSDRYTGTDWTWSIIDRDGSAAFTDSAYVNALTALREMTAFFYTDYRGFSTTDAAVLYGRGGAAALIGPQWMAGYMSESPTDVLENTVCAVLPAMPGGMGYPGVSSAGVSQLVGINPGRISDFDIAAELVTDVFDRSYFQDMMDETGEPGIYPLNPSPRNMLQPLTIESLEFTNTIERFVPIYTLDLPSPTSSAFGDILASVMDGGITPEEASYEMQAIYDSGI